MRSSVIFRCECLGQRCLIVTRTSRNSPRCTVRHPDKMQRLLSCCLQEFRDWFNECSRRGVVFSWPTVNAEHMRDRDPWPLATQLITSFVLDPETDSASPATCRLSFGSPTQHRVRKTSERSRTRSRGTWTLLYRKAIRYTPASPFPV